MKTLLQINVVANSGSTGRITEEISEAAIKQEWNSYIAYGRYCNSSKSHLIKIGGQWSIKLHALKTRLLDKHGLGSKRATNKLVNKIKQIKPDIIHIHNIHGYYLNYEILFKYFAESNIPIVWTLHDCWSFTGHCVYFDFAKCDKWKKGCYSCPQINAYPASLFLDRSKQNYIDKKKAFTSIKNMTIVTVSNWLNSKIKDSFLSRYKTEVIHNGIDTNIFNPVSSLKSQYQINDKFVIMGVANIWEPRKGLDDFIKLSKMIDKDIIIILVGLTENQINKMPNNIIGIKRTENIQQLVKLYSSADLFVNLTKEDNFPTTNIESLACGTPVLTYHTGGSIEAISKETGFIVEKGDLDGVLSAISTVKREGKSHYSRACQERATMYFKKEICYKKYIDLYNSLI